MVESDTLLKNMGNMLVELSSSNSYSKDKVSVSLAEYINQIMPLQGSSQQSNETFYLFGNNHGELWQGLLANYNRPPCTTCGEEAALSFGIGGAGSGVAFHMHGPGFSEVLHGEKRWFLYPPAFPLTWNPDHTQQTWLKEVYPFLEESQRPLECTIQPGEVLYFPNGWIHATLNLNEYTVFVSTFTLE